MTNLKRSLFYFLFFFSFVEASGQVIGRVYEDYCYDDTSQPVNNLESINQSELSAGNDNIHSVNMHSNRHFIRLFEDNNFQGEYRDIYSDMKDLHTISFEDKTSSLKAFPSMTTLPTAGEAVLSANILNAEKFVHPNGQAIINFIVPRFMVNDAEKIHVKGLGREESSGRFVVTGCTGGNDCTNGESYIILFDETGGYLDAQPLPQGIPSSTQLLGNTFPVSVWNPETETSTIRFYSINNFGGTPSVGFVSFSESITVNDRIETLSYANINNRTYILGTNQNAEDIFIWSSFFEGGVSGFQNTVNGVNADGVIEDEASIDEVWPEYRSFWLGKLAEDGRVVLFATFDEWADIWEVKNINEPNGFSFNKIHNTRENHISDALSKGTVPVYSASDPFSRGVYSFPRDLSNGGAGVGFLGGEGTKFTYHERNCGDIVDCPVPANIALPDEVCEDEEAWLSIFNDDYDAYKITICTVIPGGCHNTVSTGWQEGAITQGHRQMESLYINLAAERGHNWRFWCDNTFRVTVELQTECEDPSMAVRDIYKNCGPIVDFEVPAEVCDRDPVMLTANNSEHYTRYRYGVCLVNENQCNNWLLTDWVEGQIPNTGIDILAGYLAMAEANGRSWRFWCGNRYRVTLILGNHCDNWESERRFFRVLCEDDCSGGEAENEEPGNSGEGRESEENDNRDDRIGGGKASKSFDVEVFGNPFRTKAKFKITLEGEQMLSLRLINIEGKVVKELITNQNYQKGSYLETFDLSQLNDGIYFYQVITNTQTKSGKLIKN